MEKQKAIDQNLNLGDTVRIEITPKDFGRIAAMHARSVIVQKIKEEERRVVYDHFYCKEKDIVTGVVQRYVGENVSVSLDDKTDALLMKSEQIRGEVFKPTERIKLYIVEVKRNKSWTTYSCFKNTSRSCKTFYLRKKLRKFRMEQ